MAKSFYLVRYPRPYKPIADYFKEKSTLPYEHIFLVLDLITFLIKRELIDNEYLEIKSFGKFYVRNTKCYGKKLYFKTNRNTLKEIVNGHKPPILKKWKKFKYKYIKKIAILIRSIALGLNVKRPKAIIIFDLFIEGIMKGLVDDGFVKIRNFGDFYVHKRNFSRSYNICNITSKVRNPNRVQFTARPRFLKELNEKENDIFCLKRLKKLLSRLKFDIKVSQKKYIIKREHHD